MTRKTWDVNWIEKEILPQFELGKIISISGVGSGHINDSYRVSTETGDVFLQRINHQVFRPVNALMTNMEQLLDVMHRAGDYGYPKLIHSITGQNMIYDQPSDTYWRMTTFINGHSLANTTDPNIARQAGQAIAAFHQHTRHLDSTRFHPVIPDFHDMFWRYEQFYEACAEDVKDRLAPEIKLVDWVESMEDAMTELQADVLQHRIPIQVVHNDTKLENILFDDNQQVICLIDLDTVMPGTILYDVGDTLRTLPVNRPEDAEDLASLDISLEITTAFLEGYLAVQGDHLNAFERKWLPFAAPYMTFIMGIRFLTDYLAGDVYYKTSKEKHNLLRARNQFELVKKWIDLQPSLTGLIEEFMQKQVHSSDQR
ncbi:MAG: aminoglycoside phosphotransferase family protein [Saprospiraceae bacterium]|nr:aminoglycoside phosphotransferase family protein [Saprospiraceae bacterium]